MAPRFEALFIFWIKEITGVRAIDRAPRARAIERYPEPPARIGMR